MTITDRDRENFASVYDDNAPGYAREVREGVHDGTKLMAGFVRARLAAYEEAAKVAESSLAFESGTTTAGRIRRLGEQ